MKAALAAMAKRSGAISGSDRRRLRDHGGQHHLRRAKFEIEKLGIDHADWCRVKACLDEMIADLDD